jgi:hypothetical protein
MDEEHLNKAEGAEGTKRVSSYIYITPSTYKR